MAVARGYARGAQRVARSFRQGTRRATHAQGAGDSGLAKLIELHAVHGAADVMVALALADTLFFNVPVGEAQGKVGLYLLITMAPFVVVAPVIGPALDRLRHGRRYAMAGTFALRGALAWALAGAVGSDDPYQLYPSAFAILVLSRAYGVTRSSAVPRLLPPGLGLVKANARINLAGLLAALVSAGVAGTLTHLTDPAWSLRLAVVVFAAGAVLALRLPSRVDYVPGEREVTLTGARPRGGRERDGGTVRPRLRSVGPEVALGLRANTAIRAMSGFLIFYLAFRLRSHPVSDLGIAASLGIVAAAAAVGSGAGTSLGALLRDRKPEGIVLSALVLSAGSALLASWMYGIVSIALVALVAGLSQSVGKLSLDAMIQREIPESVRTSVFARAETLLQMSWVVGGGIGTVLPLQGDWGLGLAALGLLAMAVWVARSWNTLRVNARRLGVRPESGPRPAR